MENSGGQWAILPAMVRYDPHLPPNAKLIYAEIAAKINEEGYCFAHNRYFAERFKLKEDTVSSLIKRLADNEYIKLDLDTSRGNMDKRRIYLTSKPYDFTGKISEGGIGFKSGTGKISEGVSDLNPVPLENNNLKLNNPYNPPAGEGTPPKKKKRKPEHKDRPDFEPDIFDSFWSAYPRGENKQAAIRAWDKLKPDAELRHAMAVGLKRQLQSPDWQQGFGIPHASTWINGRRWEDELGKAVPNYPEIPERQGGYEQW